MRLYVALFTRVAGTHDGQAEEHSSGYCLCEKAHWVRPLFVHTFKRYTRVSSVRSIGEETRSSRIRIQLRGEPALICLYSAFSRRYPINAFRCIRVLRELEGNNPVVYFAAIASVLLLGFSLYRQAKR